MPTAPSEGNDDLDLRYAAAGATVEAGAGDDFVIGSRFDDLIEGGEGRDRLSGGAGNDTLVGGAGGDRMSGGAGNDTYLFRAGDLLPTRSALDHIIDFVGAGTSGSGEQDLLRFEGFGAGTVLLFDGYGAARVEVDGRWTQVENRTLQYYHVVDPTDAANNGFILVQMSGTTDRLTEADYGFAAPPPPANAAPTDIAISNATVAENQPDGTAVGTLSATDPDAGDVVTFALLDDAGAFRLAADGVTLLATRAFDYEAGPASYAVTVRATDAGGLSVERVLAVAVGNLDEAVTAVADRYDATEDTALSVGAAQGVLANDAAPDGGRQAVAGTFATLGGGSVVLDADGSFLYTPGTNFFGADSFAYTLRDADGSTATGMVTQVAGVNDAPTGSASATLPSGTEDTPYTVGAATLLQGFSDADGDALSVTGLSATNGTVLDNGDGSFTVTPAANFNGRIGLSYTVTDGNGGSIAASQGFDLAAVNDAPVARSDTAATNEDTAILIAVLPNDSDVDGGTLAITGLSTTSARGATLSIVNGQVRYDPTGASALQALNDGQSLQDSFIYTVSDGQGGSASATVQVTVAGANEGDPGTITGVRNDNVGTDTNNNFLMGVDGRYGSFFTVNAYTGERVSLLGLNRTLDTYDGRGGFDTVSGTTSNDALLLNDSDRPQGLTPHFISIEQFSLGAGNEVLNLTSGAGGSASYAVAVTASGGQGGDVLWTGAGNDLLVGDFNVTTGGSFPAGNDTLHGGAGNDSLFGDGRSVGKAIALADDLLVGGTGNDLMFGDGQTFGQDFTGTRGRNSFRFDGPGSGQDQIGAAPSSSSFFANGFQHGLDHLLLSSGYGLTTAQALARTTDNAAGNAVVNLGNGDTITLFGVHKADLTASDFAIF